MQHILTTKGEVQERGAGKEERKGGKARDIKTRAPPTAILANRARLHRNSDIGLVFIPKSLGMRIYTYI